MTGKFNSLYKILTVSALFSLTFYLIFPNRTFSKQETVEENRQPFGFQNDAPKMDESFGNIPVYFEENNGQFKSKVKYFARGTSGYSLFLTATEAVYVLQESHKSEVQSPKSRIDELVDSNEGQKTKDERRATAVFMKLVGANPNSTSVGLEQMPHKTNYFKGSESDWRTEIPNFRQIRMNNVFQGVDTVWKGKENGDVQYDFVVEPNANPNQIEWEIEGAESVEIDEKGDLLIKTEFGTIRQQKPFTYQNQANGFRQEIESKFIIKEQSQIANQTSLIKFDVGNYDNTKPLIIDPTVNLSNLSFSTFIGGNSDDYSRAIAVDRAGNIYVAGQTLSTSFPTTPGTFDPNYNGGFSDVFVSKLNASGSELIYSTFLGGSGFDRIDGGIAIDASGNAYITGQTDDDTTDFPTTAGAFDTTHNGISDVFVTKLNASGSALVYSTFLGSGSVEASVDISVDFSNNAYVTGITFDDVVMFPTTVGAFDVTHNGNLDAFLTKINPAGSALIYSTFLGGSGNDFGASTVVDSSGNAYVTGITPNDVTNFPTTPGAFDQVHNGSDDAFITKLNPAGSALIYSTFIGGSGSDQSLDLAVDATGNAYITGRTNNDTTDYPTTPNAFRQVHFGDVDAFVTKLNPAGNALVYSTFLGGTATDEGFGIAIDTSGNAFVTGQTMDGTPGFPTTAGAFDTTYNGGTFDVFVTKLNTTGSALRYSTFIGGNGNDGSESIAVDASGNAFITGSTNDSTTSYPTTTEVIQPENNGAIDSFVTKLGDNSISGRTLDISGNPLPNTAVAMSGDNTGFMLSDADGNFAFTDTVPFGTNLVSATQLLYNFNPSSYEMVVDLNKQITFVGRPTSSGPTAAFANLGGQVQSTAGNVGLPNTRLTLIDTVRGDVNVVTTDAEGDYEFESVLTGAFYLVIAEREGYNFAPQIFEVNHFNENLNLDFLATPNAPRPVQDFDGDGKTDLAVFRPNEGNWYILNSQDNSVNIVHFGVNGDIPVASDYDGDNKADLAVYRPSDGNWYRLNSSNGEFKAVHFGSLEDTPIPADFDGDSKTDLAVYRPSTGVWHRLLSEDGSYQATKFGIETDTPIASDYDSDGKADLTVYRNGTWYRMRSSDYQVEAFQFGLENDKPFAVDFDGDGRMDTAVYRPSNGAWYWLESSDGDFQAKQFGIETDVPTPADYNGDGRFEQSVFRNGTWYVLRNNNSFYSAQFGQTGDIPISGK